MSNEITDQTPQDDGRDTAPMLRQILAEVREFRHETGEQFAELKTEVAELKTDLAEFKAETRQALRDVDRTLASSQRDTLRRYVE